MWIDELGNTIYDESNELDVTTVSGTPARVLISNECFTVQSERIELFTLGLTDGDDLIIYPNPVSDVLKLKDVSEVKLVEIFDMQGSKLKTFIPSNGEDELDISAVKSGMLLVRITTLGNERKEVKLYKR